MQIAQPRGLIILTFIEAVPQTKKNQISIQIHDSDYLREKQFFYEIKLKAEFQNEQNVEMIIEGIAEVMKHEKINITK